MTKVFAVNTSLDFFEVFASEEEAIAACAGIEIAEADWLFFDELGLPLQADFSKPAYVDEARNVYGNGVYTLKKCSGKNLVRYLSELSGQRGAIWFGTFEKLQAHFGDEAGD